MQRKTSLVLLSVSLWVTKRLWMSMRQWHIMSHLLSKSPLFCFFYCNTSTNFSPNLASGTCVCHCSARKKSEKLNNIMSSIQKHCNRSRLVIWKINLITSRLNYKTNLLLGICYTGDHIQLRKLLDCNKFQMAVASRCQTWATFGVYSSFMDLEVVLAQRGPGIATHLTSGRYKVNLGLS